jgi:hypothetical protein
MFLEFPKYSKLDIKQKSKKIEKTVLLIKKPVETLLLLKLLKLNISVFPLKYKKVAIRADKKPIKDKKRYNLSLCLSL